MKAGFYSKIAADNLKKNPRLYLPRILAEAGLLGCFYIALSLALDERLANVQGGAYVISFMVVGLVILGILSLVIILYVNSFLMKRRKSEYGLYNVLGMEKRHIVRVLFSESVFTSLASLVLGTGVGVLFYKLFSLLICRLLQTDVIAGFYYINAVTMLLPAAVFIGLDLFAFVVNAISVSKLKPVELLAESQTGEREPRVKKLMLIIGILAWVGGYVIALTTKTGISALTYFFPAVILVIIGTYFLFVTGTTFVLKCLRKNKAYYYNKKHMPAVAGLLFRMKQNAVGLASITILATGILVMISTTVSLYGSMQDTLDSNYPQHLYLSAYRETEDSFLSIPAEALTDIVREAADKTGLTIESAETERYLDVAYLLRDDCLLTKTEVTDGWDLEELTGVTYITESTYEELMSKKLVSERSDFDLAPDEIVYCRISSELKDITYAPETLTINGKVYRVKETVEYFPIQAGASGAVKTIGIIVSDDGVLEELNLAQREAYGEYASEYTERIAVIFADEGAAAEADTELEKAVFDNLHRYYGDFSAATLDTKWWAKGELLGMYGAFLFLGILLGIVCLFSTILIIYYKQISEGYEDRARFQIMQKIGMEETEVRKTVKSQMLLQFFLPLVTAGVHTAAAFPMVLKLLSLLRMVNTLPAVLCALITYGVFALVYVTVYILTSKTYYKIVR